mgnify:CR=1 FL=1
MKPITIVLEQEEVTVALAALALRKLGLSTTYAYGARTVVRPDGKVEVTLSDPFPNVPTIPIEDSK